MADDYKQPHAFKEVPSITTDNTIPVGVRCCICGEIKPQCGGCARYPTCEDCERNKLDA
jgi:hypothetical protein